MIAIFSDKFKKDLTIQSEIYIAGWLESYIEVPNSELSRLCIEGEKKQLSTLKHNTLRTIWDNENKVLELKIDGFDVNYSDSDDYDVLMSKNYVPLIYFYYGFEDTVDLAFILKPDRDELSIEGNNIIDLKFNSTVKAEFVNIRKNINNDFDFLEGVVSEAKTCAKNILVIDPSEDVLVTKDSYYRLLRKKAAEVGCKEGRCIDETGKYQDSYYTYRIYKEGTLTPILFDTTGAELITKYSLSKDGGYVQIRGTVEYEEYKVGKDGEIVKIDEGITEVSGIDGVSIILESKSSMFDCTIDEAWNRVVYGKLLEEDEASWGIFHLELNYLDHDLKPQTLVSKSFKLVQGLLETYVRITEASTDFTELGDYLFLFDASGKTIHNFKLKISSLEVIGVENIKISAPTESDTDYMFSKFSVSIENFNLSNEGSVVVDFKLTTKETNKLTTPLPAKDGKFSLIPIMINLVGTEYKASTINFYLVQKPATVTLAAFNPSTGLSIDTVTLEYNQSSIPVILGVEDDTDGDYWKLTGPVNSRINVTPEVGEITGTYTTERGYSGFVLSNKDTANSLSIYVSGQSDTRLDEDLGTLTFTRYLENPNEKDLSSWRMNLSVATVTINVVKKGAPPFVNIIDDNVYVKKIEPINVNLESNIDVYCKFTPNFTKSRSNDYNKDRFEFLEKYPEYIMTVYVEGQENEETRIGKNLYLIKNTTAAKESVRIVLEVRHFPAAGGYDRSTYWESSDPDITRENAFGLLTFYLDEECTKPVDSLNIGVHEDPDYYSTGYGKDEWEYSETSLVSYEGTYMKPEDLDWKDRFFFIPPDSPVSVCVKNNYTIYYDKFDSSGHIGGILEEGGYQAGIRISQTCDLDLCSEVELVGEDMEYKGKLYDSYMSIPTYDKGKLVGNVFKCTSNAYRYNSEDDVTSSHKQQPTTLAFHNLSEPLREYYKGVVSSGGIIDTSINRLRLYFFRCPKPFYVKGVSLSNYRNPSLIPGDTVEKRYLGQIYDYDYINTTNYFTKDTEVIIPYSSEVKEPGYLSTYFANLIIETAASLGIHWVTMNLSVDTTDLKVVDGKHVFVKDKQYKAVPEGSSNPGRDTDEWTYVDRGIMLTLDSDIDKSSDSDLDVTSLGKMKFYITPTMVWTGYPVHYSEDTEIKTLRKHWDIGTLNTNNLLDLVNEPDINTSPRDHDFDFYVNSWRGRFSTGSWLEYVNGGNTIAEYFYTKRVDSNGNVVNNQEDCEKFLKFIRNLLTATITVNLVYMKDVVYVTGISDGVSFGGDSVYPTLNYNFSTESTINLRRSNGCTAKVLSLDSINWPTNEIKKAVEITCLDRSCAITYSPGVAKNIANNSTWTADFSMKEKSTGNSKDFSISGIQLGHDSGILLNNTNLYVGSSGSEVVQNINSGTLTYTVGCKAVSISKEDGSLETVSGGLEIESTLSNYTISGDNIIFSFDKNLGGDNKQYTYTITHKNSDGIVDSFTLTINQGGITPILEWSEESGNTEPYTLPFLSDGTCCIGESSTLVLNTNVETLYVTRSPAFGSSYLEESYTEDLYGVEDGVFGNGDVKYKFTIPIQLDYNNTNKERSGILEISTSGNNDSNAVTKTFNCVQGYYTLKVSPGANQQAYTKTNAIEVNSDYQTYPVSLYISAEKKEYVLNSGSWVLTTLSVPLPETITYFSNVKFYPCNEEGNKDDGLGSIPLVSPRVEINNTASSSPTLTFKWDSSSSSEFYFKTDGFKITLLESNGSFYNKDCNYMFYGNILELSLDEYYYHYITD